MSVEKNQLVSRFGNFIQSESPAKAKQVQSSAKSSGMVAVKSQSVESGSETKERLIKQAVDKADRSESHRSHQQNRQIGRASCRERV